MAERLASMDLERLAGGLEFVVRCGVCFSELEDVDADWANCSECGLAWPMDGSAPEYLDEGATGCGHHEPDCALGHVPGVSVDHAGCYLPSGHDGLHRIGCAVTVGGASRG